MENSYNAGLNTITDLLNARGAHQRSEATIIKARPGQEVIEATWLKATGQLTYSR